MKKYLYLIFILVLSATGCQYFTLLTDKDWQNKTGNSSNVDVYVGGYYQDSGNQIACYWKNGVRTDLASISSPTDAVNSISVDGNNIYCGGYYNSIIACYWKNNNFIPLQIAYNNISAVNYISAVNGVVYSCGFEIPTTLQKACYWVNNKEYFLPENPSYPSSSGFSYNAISIFVDPATYNFYIAGNIQGTSNLPCYWINGGECKILPTSTNNGNVGNSGSVGSPIYFSNGKLYFAGTDNNNACYWDNVNSFPKIVTDGSGNILSSIFIYNGYIYTCGIDNNVNGGTATVWKNQQIFQQPTGLAATYNSIYVFNNDIYVCYTNGGGIGCYSKNGQEYTLPIPSGDTSSATSMVVKAGN